MKNLLKKNLYNVLYFLVLFVFSILVLLKLNFAVYFLFSWIGFGWSVFFFGKRLNLLEHFFLSFIIFTVLFIAFCILLAFLNIKLTVIVGVIFLLMSVLVFIFTKVFNKENINTKVEKWDYLILFLLLCSAFAKVASVVSFEVPGLHDPITHAYYSKQIVDTGYINYFYSPGLHILSAFGKLFNGFNVTKQVLYITNFFNAYIGVVVYLFVKHTFKKSFVWSTGSALLFSLWFFPATFFVNAGKNALILGLVVLFLFMFLVEKNRESYNTRLVFLINIALASIFLIHYPTAVWACIYLFVVFLLDFKKHKFKTVLLGLGLLFGVGWMLKTYSYRLLDLSEAAVDASSALYTIAPDTFNRMVDFVKHIWITWKFKNDLPDILLAVFAVLGLFFVIFKSFTETRYRTLLLWFLGTSLFALLLHVFSVSPLAIVLETYWISLFLFAYIFAGVFVAHLYKNINKLCKGKLLRVSELMFICYFVVLTVLFSIKMYRTFNERNDMHNVIHESDLRSFDWINENIPDEEKFLINANGGNGLVFSTDGGGWLEVFTDNEISKPFYHYGSKQTGDNLNLYYQLKEDLGNCEYIDTFVSRGYKYYYQGSDPVFDRPLGKEDKLVGSGRFELLFENGNSEVYKLIPCE